MHNATRCLTQQTPTNTCVCVAVFPQLFTHMLAQRRKVIGAEQQQPKRD